MQVHTIIQSRPHRSHTRGYCKKQTMRLPSEHVNIAASGKWPRSVRVTSSCLPGSGLVLTNFSCPSLSQVFFSEWSKHWLTSWKSTFMFGRCCRGSVVVTSVKNTHDLKILVGTSIKSEIYFMREINGRSFSVTQTTAHYGHRALTLSMVDFFLYELSNPRIAVPAFYLGYDNM